MSEVDPGLVLRATERFRERFPGGAPRVAAAPGRVNLIGEHTDYNAGLVLPMAIARHAAVAFRPRSDSVLRAHSVAFDETREAAVAALAPPGDDAASAGRHGWFAYVAGVLWAFASEGLPVCGVDLVVDGDVPIGSGLSSSAALEMAVARALAAATGAEWDAPRLAKLGQKAENQYVGMSCGIMDQFASAACERGSALLLDCRSLETRAVAVPEGVAVVVMDTGARRSLAGSAYNERRASCERVVAEIAKTRPGVVALRDVSAAELEAAALRLDALDLKRARHVVAEIARPAALAAAFAQGDLAQAGRLMKESHASLRDLYEVSCEELDLITALARRQPSCFGARMTGAGFGGCAIALVDAADTDAFCEEVLFGYKASHDLPAALYPCRPVAGAHLLE
jgi:galactokinase